jgi:hypothetical protein
VDFEAAFNGNVQFSGAGALQLAQDSYSGTIAGFGFGDAVDLRGLTYASGATATLNGAILTVVSGSVTNKLTLNSPTATKFTVTKDAQGGSVVTAGSGAALPDDLTTLAYKSSYEVIWTPATGVLSVIDTAQSDASVATLQLQPGAEAGDTFTLASDGASGTLVSAVAAPWANIASGNVLVSNISGAPYVATENLFSAGVFAGTDLFYAATGQAYNSYGYDYAPGGENIGSAFFYTGVAGSGYASEEVDYDGGNHLTRNAFTGVTGQSYSAYEYDYVGGVYAGLKLTITAVPAGASFSSYETDYTASGAFAGDKFFFTNVAGQFYTSEEEDFNASGQVTRVLLGGIASQPFYALEEDYSAGAYVGDKAFYAVTGQAYSNEEVDVSAAGTLEKVIYSGMSGTPYSSVEQDFSGGALTGVVFSFTNVSGGGFSAYQVTDNASQVALQETIDLNNGGHSLVALASGQTLTSLGDDTMTGNGATTFVLNGIYGADTINNFTSGDTISLPTAEYAQLSQAIQNGAYSGGNATLSFSNGETLTIDNMTKATLAGMAGSFISHA